MNIVKYDKKYCEEFIRLNLEWIDRYYEIEPSDRKMLKSIDEYIQKGAMIYFAVEDEQVLATCMIEPHEDNVWEICKLAAAEQYTGKGAGSAVFEACLNYAIEHGAKKIELVTGSILKPALHIYKKFNFQEVPLDRNKWPYKRAELAFEKIID